MDIKNILSIGSFLIFGKRFFRRVILVGSGGTVGF